MSEFDIHRPPPHMLPHSLVEAARCLGIYQVQDDTNAVAYWNEQVEMLIRVEKENREALEAEVKRLNDIINVPHTDDWFEAVKLEAAHQIERWGVSHDKAKEPSDWFWLLGYLSGKALASAIKGDTEKALHHTISSGAVLLNWWRHMRGIETTFQPGQEQES